MSSEQILKVEDLSLRFILESGAVSAVKDLSFEVRRGSTFGIVGESGSGKTVTDSHNNGLATGASSENR